MTGDSAPFVALMRERSSPLAPIPTGVTPVLKKLTGIRAVLFDVYGTLFVSASGELGSLDASVHASAFVEAVTEVGLALVADPEVGSRRLTTTIETTHDRLRATRVEFPEVDIVKVWRDTLAALASDGVITGNVGEVDIRRLALAYELRSNPVWPMPGAQRCLSELAARGLAVGVVSNGQWFTPMLFPALMGGCLETLGVPRDLQLWSYETGEAKPGLTLYRRAAAVLGTRGIDPADVLMVGNDMLCDVAAAKTVGFRTALFAGDDRSLRLRADDARTADVHPDLVVLHLADIVRCVRTAD